MSSGWSVVRKTESEKTGAPELRAHNGKTRTHCGTMESCLTFPQFHSTAATRDGYTIYDSDGPKKAKTKAKNSLDSETQKRDNGKWYVTN